MSHVPFGELSEIKQVAILHKLTHPTATYPQMAKALGISKDTLNNWRLGTLADSYRGDLLQLVLARIEKEALKAVDKLTQQLESSDERIAQTAAIKLLEWHIGKPTQRTENLNANLVQVEIVQTGMDVDRL
jgi:transcriptional regulator with XRE-family HTH domain